MMRSVTRVGDISEQIRGVTYAKSDASDTPADGLVPLLRAGNITDSGLVVNDLLYVPQKKVNARQMLHAGDVLLAASSGSLSVVGKAARVEGDLGATFGAFCKVLRPGKNVDPNYFSHFFRTTDYRRRISSVAGGANINNLRNEDLDNLEIPLPPLPEQRRIAAILDHADTLRAKRCEAAVKMEELSESIFVEMFSRDIEAGEYITLGEALKSIDSGRSPKCQSRPATDGEYGVLKLSAVTTGTYLPGENKALPLDESADASNEVRVGDILFSRKNTRELVAASAYVRSTPARMLLPDLIFRLNLRADVGLDPRYVQRALMYPLIRSEIQRLAGGSAGSMPNVSKAKLTTVRIPRPSVDKQREFRRRIEKVEHQIAEQFESEKALDTLFTSLQSRAFRGEL